MLITKDLNIQNSSIKVDKEEINKIIDLAIERDPSLIIKKINYLEEPEVVPEVIVNSNDNIGTNCLALAVKKDYNLDIAKNAFLKGLRMSFKVAVSTFFLNIARIFL